MRVTLLLAVFRSPGMLKALLSQRVRPFEPEGEGDSDPYHDTILPLDQVPDALCPWRDADVKAWRSLSKVPKMSSRAAQAVTRVLLSTVIEPGLSVSDPGEIVFGAKAIDLRTSLCHPVGERQLIDLIGAQESSGASELPDWHWTHRQEIAELPSEFRYYFLWRLSLKTWDEVLVMVAMFESLNLSEDLPLARGVARLAAASDGDSLLWWCDALADVDSNRRIRSLEFVLALGLKECRPNDECRRAMQSGGWPELYIALETLLAAR